MVENGVAGAPTVGVSGDPGVETSSPTSASSLSVDLGQLSERASAGVAWPIDSDNDLHPAGAPNRRQDQLRLAFASFLMLFVELVLIRWVASNNVYVTNATNFVLLGSFLGIGIGFLNARARRDYVRLTPLALLALVGFVLAFPVTLSSLVTSNPFRGLAGMPALPRPVSLAVVFLLVTALMSGLGQGVARIFIRFDPLRAYRLDILGSIAGIAVFSALSFLHQPPETWGVIAGVGVLVLLPRVRWWHVAAVGGVIVMLALESLLPNQMWSPYNKLSIKRGGHAPAVYVSANNIPYQAARSVAVMRKQKQFYFEPYQHVSKADLRDVLIIGAGTGDDTAVALSEGARHIDVVEIDPSLLAIGQQYHPNHPYRDPRVTIHIGDGRAYLQNTSMKYDVILYALPDSLSAVTGQSGIRLENYLLTEQGIAVAEARLTPGGTFSMYNYYAPFLLNRYATTVKAAFGHAPCVDGGAGLGGRQMSVLTVRRAGPVPNCRTYWHGQRVAPATDDHPFPYLPNSTIPVSDLLMLGSILLGSLVLIRLSGGKPGHMREYLDLAFMGAAFLLLETKNIVQFALLFGTTWFVNSLVFTGVLLAAYLAVETADRVRLPRPWMLYLPLIAALALAWAVPPKALLALPLLPRFVAASAIAFAPIYLANLVFAQRFAITQRPTAAFAANLLGALAGGALEYISLITGYRALLIVVGVLYGLAFATGLRKRVSPGVT